jgi:uncharacterized membrane protein YebE (DUF533 family)
VQSEAMTKSTISPQEALIYAMVAAAAADRTIAQMEIARMHSMVSELPAFRAVEDAWFSREAQQCGKILSKPGGIDRVVRLIAQSLTGELRETAYALAADVAASDVAIKDDERNFLDLLSEGLQLDPLVCAALQRSAQVRHRPI